MGADVNLQCDDPFQRARLSARLVRLVHSLTALASVPVVHALPS
jgi:hypothetical protein